MLHTIQTTWNDKMSFDSQIDGHTLRLDTRDEMGDDTGPGPKKLLLAGLAGCTGMDVVSLLKKMRVPFTGMKINIDADLTEEHPKVYSEIRLIYQIFGSELDKGKVQKAVDLSQEKYCGVTAMLKKNCPVNYSIEYRDENVA